jgi:hypothetical protein
MNFPDEIMFCFEFPFSSSPERTIASTVSMLFGLVLSSVLHCAISIPLFELLRSDPPPSSQSGTPPDSDPDGIKTIVTLSVVSGVGAIVVIILVALCCSNRAAIKTPAPATDPPARTAFDALWRNYTDMEDISTASAWSESARSTMSFAGPAEVLCPTCHAKHVHAVDLGLPRELQEPCPRTIDFSYK